MLSLIQSATNVKLGRKEDRSLLYVVSMVSSINSNMGYDKDWRPHGRRCILPRM